MTEQEWTACTNPWAMIEFLAGKVSGRKSRLLAVAYARHVLHLVNDLRIMAAVETVERYTVASGESAETPE